MSHEKGTLIIDSRVLLRFTQECFCAAGFSAEEADLIADSLIEADLRGLNTHGVIRIPMYLNRVRKGLIDPQSSPSFVVENENMAIFDAENGMGQPVSVQAMELAMEKAGKATVGIVGVRNSNHFGAAAYYTMMAAHKQYLGFCCSNTEPLMPAPGGIQAAVGNNPLSIGIPAGKKPAIVVDMAVSAAAIGKIVLAQKKGVNIPIGWAIDRWGNDTIDPAAALDGGLLLPVGGPKGYGLALVVDILAGILMGSGFGQGVKSPFNDLLNQQRAGHMFMAIDISKFLDVEKFTDQVGQLIVEIKNSPKKPGVEEIFLPGEIEYNTKKTRLQEGVPLPESLVQELQVLAQELGVEENLI